MGFLKNNPMQSSRAYPILSDVSGFPGSKIGDTFDSCNIGHGPLKRCGSSGVHPLALDRGTLWLWTRLGGADKLGSNMRGGKTHRRNTGPMLSSPRCRARTCSGKPCRSPAVRGKRRPDAWRCPRFRRSSRQYLRPVHARSSCGIKTAAQCLQAIARAPAKDVVSDAPRPRTPTAATSSARVPSVSDDDAQNWRCRWGRVAEIWGADQKVVASRLCALRASTSAVRQTDRLRGAAHPVVNIRTSEHHIPSRPRLSVRMFGSWGKKRANASSNCAAL